MESKTQSLDQLAEDQVSNRRTPRMQVSSASPCLLRPAWARGTADHDGVTLHPSARGMADHDGETLHPLAALQAAVALDREAVRAEREALEAVRAALEGRAQEVAEKETRLRELQDSLDPRVGM